MTSEDPGPGWDAFVATRGGHIMQSRAWAGVRRAGGWRPFFVRVEDNGELQATALVLERRLLPTVPGLLYIPAGPVLDWHGRDVVQALGRALRDVAARRRAVLLQTDPAVPRDRGDVARALEAMGFERQEKIGLFRLGQPQHLMQIPLERHGGPVGLLAALPHKTRYNIGLAERRGVVVTAGTDRAALERFYALLAAEARSKRYPVRGFRYHEAIWRHCLAVGASEYLFAEYDGELLAAIQVLRFGGTAWAMYVAAGPTHRNLMPMYLLHWTGIVRSWEAGCTIYDMRGVYSATPSPDDPRYGIYDFKRKFNAELVSLLGEYDLPLRPRLYALWRSLERLTQKPAARAYRAWQRIRMRG